MLRDLNAVPSTSVRADVAIVGAGLVGLTMAARLARRGKRVVVLESGGETQAEETHPLNEVVQSGHPYRGADIGRARCLGGTSTRWGGAMLPFLAADLGAHTAGWDVDWPVSLDDVSPHFDEIARLFDLPAGPFEIGGSEPFAMRSAKWPAFTMRNAAQVFRADIAGPSLQIWLNANVARFKLDEAGRLASVTAIAPSGAELKVEAPFFIVAAGAIESARLLLLLDAQHDDRLFAPDNVLGRYFHDHLSAPAAEIEPIDRGALNAAFALRFDRSGMRDVRLEPTAAWRKANKAPAGFAHVAAVSQGGDGFTALRAIYRGLQRRSAPAFSDIAALMGDFPWFAHAAWQRFVKGRLLAPSRAVFELTLVIEQKPVAENRISLAPDRKDAYGNPLAKIEWRVGEADLGSFRLLQSALAAHWAVAYPQLGTLKPVAEEDWRARLLNGADIYHPGGATRMGRSAADGVVDRDLKTFRIDNLHVVSTSAFPSGGTSNPSFMLLAFGLRAADHIGAKLKPATATLAA